MIRSISVDGLFGLYNYNISFPQKPTVKILTGPNGYGKTSLLIAIDHLFKGDLWFFHFFEFKKIRINFKEKSIVINRSYISNMNDSDILIDNSNDRKYEEIVSLLTFQEKEIEHVTINEDYIQGLLKSIKRKFIRDSFDSQNDEDLIARYYEKEDDEYIQQHCRNISVALQEYDTLYLPAQRVFIRKHNSYPFRSHHYSYEIDRVNEEISRLYRNTLNSFASASQRIDATYISRLIKRSDEYSKEDIELKLRDLKSKIEGYKELNLINNMEILDNSIEDEVSFKEFNKVLSLYIDDMNEKMKQFETFYKNISLYKQIIDKKVLSEKSIDFCENGLIIKNINGHRLTNLHKLSSGEQNLLILYFNLVFRANSNTILLIDEPENSIHVAWLSKMLNDYIEMANTIGYQIILATHSPTFIDGRWDLCTDLYRQFKGKDSNEQL